MVNIRIQGPPLGNYQFNVAASQDMCKGGTIRGILKKWKQLTSIYIHHGELLPLFLLLGEKLIVEHGLEEGNVCCR